MIVYKWQGISCDLSVSSLVEGIRQLREKTDSMIVFILVNTSETWCNNLFNDFKQDNPIIKKELCGVIFILSELIHPEGFIIVCESCIFLGSDPIY